MPGFLGELRRFFPGGAFSSAMNWYRFAIPEMPPPLPSKSEEETRSPCPAKPFRPRPELERIRRLSHTSYTTTAETMPTDEGELSTTEQGGMRLVRHPLRGYERSNLKFIQGGFGSTDLLEAGVIRSFNVLIYFDGIFAVRWKSGWRKFCAREASSFATATTGHRSPGYSAGTKQDCSS